MNKKVSIIVPIYNSEKSIEFCLNSLISQSYTNLEIILVNDGSKDNSKKKCESFKEKDSRIILINKENTGVSDTRNKGIEIASGEYLAFVDSDDIIDKNMIKELVNLIEKGNDLAICNLLKINDYNIMFNSSEDNIVEYSQDELIYELFKSPISGFLWNKLYLTNIIKENNIKLKKSVHVCEDLLFNVQYALHTTKSSFIDKKLYGYYQDINSSFNKKNNLKWFSIYDANIEIKKLLESHNVSNKVLDNFYYQFCYISCEAIGKNKINDEKYKDINIFKEVINQYYSDIKKSKNISLKQKLKLTIYRYMPKTIFKYKQKKLKGR